MPLEPGVLLAVLTPLLARARANARAVKPAGRPPAKADGPITPKALERHLNGGPYVGVYPMLPGSSTTLIGLLDFDAHRDEMSWEAIRAKALEVFEHLANLGYHPIAWRSSGGHGVHIYLLWNLPQPAALVRSFLAQALNHCGLTSGNKGVLAGQCEIFPKQDSVGADGYGNMFVLPFAALSVPLDPLELQPLPVTSASTGMWVASKPIEGPVEPATPVSVQAKAPFTLLPLDRALICSALAAIPNDGFDLDYDQWRNIIFSIHHATAGSAEGFELAEQFSARSPKHVHATFAERTWPYVKATHQSEHGPITVAYLFRTARGHGWSLPPEIVFDDSLQDLDGWTADITERIEAYATIDEDGELLPEPRPQTTDGGPPVFNPSYVPSIIGQWALNRARVAGHDPAGYALAAIGAASGAITINVSLCASRRNSQYITALNLWALNVGEPGSGKTPMITAAFARLFEIDLEVRAGNKKRYAQWAMEKEAGGKGPPPVDEQVVLTDFTFEAFVEILAHNPRGVAIITDEMAGFIKGMGQYKSRESPERSRYIQGWSGTQPYSQARRGKAPLEIGRFAISVFGGTQPKVLARGIAEAMEDGFDSRILFALLHDAHRLNDKGACLDEGLDCEYRDIITRLYGLAGAQLKFSEEAQGLFDQAVEDSRARAKRQDNVPLAFHLYKWPTHLARLAGLFHLIEWAHESAWEGTLMGAGPRAEVSLQIMEQAHKCLTWLYAHQIAFYEDHEGFSPGTDLARAIGPYITTRTGEPTITRRTLARYCKVFRNAPEQAQRAAINQLMDDGWLLADVSARKHGRRGNTFGDGTAWKVNPLIYERFKEVAEIERARRAVAFEDVQALRLRLKGEQ